METTGIPLAAGLGVNATDGTSALPLAVLGLFLAWHGFLVYSGTVKVAPQRLWAFLQRPDIDLACAWVGSGLVLWGIGWFLSIPPFLPVDIFGQVVAWGGAVVFLVGVVCYVYLPRWLRPAWARTAPTLAAAAQAAAAQGQPTADQVTAGPDGPAAQEGAAEPGQPAQTDQPVN